jgi:Heavy metal associated domain 2
MLAAAAIAHAAYGRTRFKIPARRRDEEYFSTVERELRSAPGVAGVEVNPITASVLVHHRGPVEAVCAFAEKKQLFQASATPERPHDLLLQRASVVDSQVRHVTGHSLDLRSLALILLMSTGLVQLLRGQFAAPALTVFWYAATLYTLSERDADSSSRSLAVPDSAEAMSARGAGAQRPRMAAQDA